MPPPPPLPETFFSDPAMLPLHRTALGIQETIKTMSHNVPSSEVDAEAFLNIHNRYINDCLQGLFSQFTEPLSLSGEWPVYPIQWKLALLNHVCDVYARPEIDCDADAIPHIQHFANSYDLRYMIAKGRYLYLQAQSRP